MNVHIPTPLRSYTGGASTVQARGDTLGALLDDLEVNHPGIRFRMIDEQDRVRPHIKFFVGNEHNDDLDVSLPSHGQIHIICALSGG